MKTKTKAAIFLLSIIALCLLQVVRIDVDTIVNNQLDQAEHIKSVLKKVVNANVANQLITKNYDTLKHGILMNAAILFCDIRNFTRISESLEPQEIIHLLNDYYSKMAQIVTCNNGSIDKFIGDAILAVFTSKEPSAAVNNAVRAAFQMLEKTNTIKLSDGATLTNGIGISFGEVVAGVIGSRNRYEYTVLGDPVNVASRLEGLTKN